MQPAPLADDEAQRLETLLALNVLDSAPEAEFDALVQVASIVCGVPISLISLVDAQRQWFKAQVGLPGATQTPRDMAFCAHAILGDTLFEVPDATLDARFFDNPLVQGAPDIRFYAGMPIHMGDGMRVGTLCVIDRQPRQLDATQRQILGLLAQAVAKALEGREAMRMAHHTTQALLQSEDRLRHLYQATPTMLHSIDMQGRLLTVSDTWLSKLGYTRDEVLGQLSSDYLTPASRAYARDTVMPAFFAQGRCDDIAYQMLTKSGEVIDVLLSGILERGPDGQPLRSMAAIEDVTLRYRFERALVDERLALQESNERKALATDSGGIGIWEWDVANGSLHCDAWMHRLYGLELHEDMDSYALWAQLVHPEDLAGAEQAVQAAAAGGAPLNTEFRVVWPDGSVHHLRSTGIVKHGADGQAVRMFGTNRDITEARRLTAQLAEQHELLRVTLQSIGDAVITTDARGQVVWLNPVAETLTGWLNAEALGRPLEQVLHIVHQETRAIAENPVAVCLQQGGVASLPNQTLLISRGGGEFGIEDSAAPIRNAQGEVLGAVLVFHDVTEQRRLSGEMSYRASHDALTGLVNRPEFESRLGRALRRVHEERAEHALLYIDLDQFKLVNDACGHAVGDQLLQQVAKLLATSMRERDTLARLGGDEFGIILEHCKAEQAQRVAQQICDRMDDFRFVHDGRRFRIGASIGLVPVDGRWTSTEALQQAADTSCYAAKEAGRNRVHTWFDSDAAMRARHGEMQWTTRIEHALDEDRFVLYAQRIESLRSAPPGVHGEVLIRMRDTDGSLVSPGAFLPAAERFHLASRIDRWVVKQAIAWMQALPSVEVVNNLSINLSGQSVGDRAFHRWALEMLGSAGPAICARLCFEVTETSAVTNLADAALFIEQIRAVGVRVALDDFGAGASSFGYLKTLPVDYLKIDGQFIRDVVDDPLDDAAVRCFVDVARVVGVKTVAEFVDHPAVLARLREIGVDFVQGFLLHKPAPMDELLALQTLPTAA
jgi:diguanylate cyclase (GGDEF)-like protein/PAS domain S-box-containing protein